MLRRSGVVMSEITMLIQAARADDPAALDRLFSALYDDLRQLARSKLRRATPMTSLDTTALVHESYLRFLKAGELKVEDRPHFLAYAARVMRSIVVDIIRQRMADRRGGDAIQVTLNTNIAESVSARDDEVILVNDALEELGKIDPRLVKVVEMRYFAGMREDEIAESLGVSTRTVERDWEKARLFLYRALK
jgi:RNA polymerase sigma factor (TIGR02999 family)